MNDFHYKHFLKNRGIVARIIIGAILSAIICFFVGLGVSIAGLFWLGVVWAGWVIFNIAHVIYVIVDGIPNRKGAVRTSSVMKVRTAGPGQAASLNAKDSTIDNMRFDLIEKPVNFRQYILAKKYNRNVLICGTPGSGKSLLTRYLLEQFADHQKVIFNFKARDVYLSLGEDYPIMKMVDSAPNPFVNSEAFTNAFLTAFAIHSPGIQGASVGSIVRDNAKNTKTWSEFSSKLETAKRNTKDKNIQSAITFIQTQTSSLVSKTSTLNIADENIVYDFSGLNDAQKTFYAEVLLRQIWDEIEQHKRKDIIICVDEAHRLTKAGGYTIYVTIAREIRSSGMLWTATQFYTDMGVVVGDFDTQFVFKTTRKEDLDALFAIDHKLSWAASSMPRYTFTDASYGDAGIHYVVPEFRLYYNPEDKQPKYVQIAYDETPPTEQAAATEKAKLDFEQEVWTILSTKDMDYVSNMAKEIQARHPEYAVNTRKDWDNLKLSIRTALLKLENSGDVKHLEKKQEGKTMYFRTSKNMSPEHKEMEEYVKSVLDAKNIRILRVSKSGARPAPDIETPDFDIELETGKKHSIKDLLARLDATTKPTVIVLPNESVLVRYSKLKSKNVHVVSLENFEDYLENQLAKN